MLVDCLCVGLFLWGAVGERGLTALSKISDQSEGLAVGCVCVCVCVCEGRLCRALLAAVKF